MNFFTYSGSKRDTGFSNMTALSEKVKKIKPVTNGVLPAGNDGNGKDENGIRGLNLDLTDQLTDTADEEFERY
jgi:hypothetical protein